MHTYLKFILTRPSWRRPAASSPSRPLSAKRARARLRGCNCVCAGVHTAPSVSVPVSARHQAPSVACTRLMERVAYIRLTECVGSRRRVCRLLSCERAHRVGAGEAASQATCTCEAAIEQRARAKQL